MEQTLKLIIGADIVPTEKSRAAFAAADTDALLGAALYARLQAADLRIFNLESPLADRDTPIAKCGPALRAPTACVAGVKALAPSLLTLANNHCMDHGPEGLQATMHALETAGIPWVGAGADPASAQKAALLTAKGITVGVYACTEHEFSVVQADAPGANPFDPLESYDHVQALRAQCDYLIVLYHGGKEYYRYPSPGLQRYCRKFVDKGADLVVCQHSHCVGCAETYAGKTIVYGQGNFLFDKKDDEFWNSSLLLEVTLEAGKAHTAYIPLVRTTPGTRPAQAEQAREILDGFAERSREIVQPDFVAEQYADFAARNGREVLARLDWISQSFVFRAANKLSGGRLRRWYFDRVVLPRRGLAVRNTIECEAWNELLVRYLKP